MIDSRLAQTGRRRCQRNASEARGPSGPEVAQECQGRYHEGPAEGLVVMPSPPVYALRVDRVANEAVWLCEKCCVEELHELLRSVPDEIQRRWLGRFYPS